MWTQNEVDMLIELYPSHTTKELCEILGKTEGQIRGKKERLGLRDKFHRLTGDQINRIREYYQDNPNEIDLFALSNEIGVPRTSISRIAHGMGITNTSRSPTESSKEKNRISVDKFYKSDWFINEGRFIVAEKTKEYMSKNHPRGMLGKHHNEDTRKRMSESHKYIWDNMTPSDRRDLVSKMREGMIARGGHSSGDNTYSRCNGGYRDDIGVYVRSSWEANIIRLFNFLNIQYMYEPMRFTFPSDCAVISYLPDFYLPDYDLWVEVKGWMDEKSAIRIDMFEEYYPEEFRNLAIITEKQYKVISREYKNVVPFWESKNKHITNKENNNGK